MKCNKIKLVEHGGISAFFVAVSSFFLEAGMMYFLNLLCIFDSNRSHYTQLLARWTNKLVDIC